MNAVYLCKNVGIFFCHLYKHKNAFVSVFNLLKLSFENFLCNEHEPHMNMNT